jgi:hypothetical protein
MRSRIKNVWLMCAIDPVLMLQSLFQARGDLAAPSPGRGFDHSADGLFCDDSGD